MLLCRLLALHYWLHATGGDNWQCPSRAGYLLLLHWCRPWPWVSLSGGEPWEELTRFRMETRRWMDLEAQRRPASTRFEHPASTNPSTIGDRARRPPVMMRIGGQPQGGRATMRCKSMCGAGGRSLASSWSGGPPPQILVPGGSLPRPIACPATTP